MENPNPPSSKRPFWFRLGVFAVASAIAVACASGGKTTSNDTTDVGSGGSAGAGGDVGAGGDQTGAGGDTAGSTTSGGQGTTGGFPNHGGSAGAPGAGMFGAMCSANSDCMSAKCVDISNGGAPSKVCVSDCKIGSSCPTAAHCTVVGGTPECIPDRDSPCAVCTKTPDCKNSGDVCAASMDAEQFCAQDCSQDGACPMGLTCQSLKVGTKMVKACAPAAGAACPCEPNRDGALQPCTATMGMATCTGTQACDGKTSKFGACNAPMPMPEVCNGKDDDCDGKVDDVPHTMCNCMMNGMCSPTCDMGFTRYPATADGCPCAIDAMQGATCAAARDLGDLVDTGGTGDVLISGTLASDAEVDWLKVDLKDAMETGKNTYHVNIKFDANPGMEFAFVAQRGGDCTMTAALPVLTSYDFCVNYSDTVMMKGENPCGSGPGLETCADNSSPYVIGVQRAKTAAAKTCSTYQLHIFAGAGPCVVSSFDACGGM